jgi:molybdopterin converting factor small subunit
MMIVRVAISGRNYDAAQSVPEKLSLPEGASLDDALKAIAAFLPSDRQISESCLLAVGGVHVGTVASHQPQALKEGDELLLLAPVAGG